MTRVSVSKLYLRTAQGLIAVLLSSTVFSLHAQTERAPRQQTTKMQKMGPHGGHLIEDKKHAFEVQVDPEKKSVDVYTLRSTEPLPRQVAVVLYRNPDTEFNVELTAIDPTQALPQFHGNLSVADTPFVGLSIRLG